MTALSKKTGPIATALIPGEYIQNCEPWAFLDIQDPFGSDPKFVQAQKQWQDELERVREQAYQEGWKQAQALMEQEHERKLSEFQEHLSSLNSERISALVESAIHSWNQVQSDLADAVMTLSLDIASQVVAQEVKQGDKTWIVPLIQNALQQLGASDEEVLVRLHPEDWEPLRQILPASLGQRAVRWMPDPGLKPQEALVDCAGSHAEISIAQRLIKARAALEMTRQDDSDD